MGQLSVLIPDFSQNQGWGQWADGVAREGTVGCHSAAARTRMLMCREGVDSHGFSAV